MIGLVGIFSDKVIDLRTTRTYLSGSLADTISPHGLEETAQVINRFPKGYRHS